MRSFAPIVCNQAGAVVLGIVSVKLISTFVPPAVNGPYSLFVTLTQIGILVTHAGIVNHATRYWQREQAQAGAYLRFLWTANWEGLKFLAPVLLGVSVILAATRGEPVWLWMFPGLVACNVALTLNLIANGVFNAGQEHWRVLGLSFTGGVARVLLPIGLALGTGMTFAMLSLGYTLHALLLLLWACWFFLFSGDITGAPAAAASTQTWSRELKDYGRPFVLLGVGGWLLQNIDRWIVLHFYGTEQLGYFAFAMALGAIVPGLAAGALMQWFFPKVFRSADAARTVEDWQRVARRCDQVTGAFVGLVLAGGGVLHVVSPYLVGPLIAKNYIPALPMIFSASLVIANASVNQFYYLLLQGQHNSAGMVKVMLILAVFKTAGSVVAAMMSWNIFLGWLVVCLAVSWVAGRSMILHLVLTRGGPESAVVA